MNVSVLPAVLNDVCFESTWTVVLLDEVLVVADEVLAQPTSDRSRLNKPYLPGSWSSLSMLLWLTARRCRLGIVFLDIGWCERMSAPNMDANNRERATAHLPKQRDKQAER